MRFPTALGAPANTNRNRGFTIVELLVSLALIIFIMSLVSTIFVLATKSFRDMKAAGDLAEQLRSAGQIIRSMVKAKHFEGNLSPSDLDFWKPKGRTGPISPPFADTDLKDPSGFFWRTGYFRLDQSQLQTGTAEGTDLDGIPQWRFDGNQDHKLSMTVILDGNSPSDIFSSYFPSNRPTFLPVSPNSIYFENANLVQRPKAEVAFFLANQDSIDPPTTGILSGAPQQFPLYALYMKTWLIKESSDGQSTINDDPNYNFSTPLPRPALWNDLTTLSNPSKRASLAYFQAKPTTASRKADPSIDASTPFVLRNVISFEVQLLNFNGQPIQLTGTPGFFDTSPEANWQPGNPNYTAINGAWAASNWLPNTGSNSPSPRISGIRITIRVYDPDNEITRQMTIIEPL